MPAGGVAVGSNVILIQVVFLGVGAEPANGCFAIFESRGKRGFLGHPIIDGDGDKSQLRELDNVPRHAVLFGREARLIPLNPAAAVDDHNSRPWLVPTVLLHRQVQSPGVVSVAVRNIEPDFDIRRINRFVRESRRKKETGEN